MEAKSFQQAAQEYDGSSRLFRALAKYQSGIADLRRKGASYQTIRELLEFDGLSVSAKTLARFCQQMLTSEGQPNEASRKPVLARKSSLLTSLNLAGSNLNTSDSPRKRGPRIANSKDL